MPTWTHKQQTPGDAGSISPSVVLRVGEEQFSSPHMGWGGLRHFFDVHKKGLGLEAGQVPCPDLPLLVIWAVACSIMVGCTEGKETQ